MWSRVQDFGVWVSGIRLRAKDFGFGISGLWFWV